MEGKKKRDQSSHGKKKRNKRKGEQGPGIMQQSIPVCIEKKTERQEGRWGGPSSDILC